MKGKIVGSLVFGATVLSAAVLFLFVGRAEAANFDPNNLLADSTFVDVNSMDEAAIQNFLVSKGSCLAGVDPAELGKRSGSVVISNTKSAARIIYEAAQGYRYDGVHLGDYKMNPRVLLATLQKEQSLITLSCTELDAINGDKSYLEKAMGYNVPDTLGITNCLYTFYHQLLGNSCSGDAYLGAARAFRRNFDLNRVGPGGSYTYPQSFVVQTRSWEAGNSTITPQSKATALLYRYTPYVYNGNFNFWNIYSQWFQVVPFSLKKGSGAGIFAVYANTRYHITDMDTFYAWKMQNITIDQVEDSELNALAEGPAITRVIRPQGGELVYMVDNGTKRHIARMDFLWHFGMPPGSRVDLPIPFIDYLRTGAPIGFFTRAVGGSEVYLISKGRKYYVPTGDVMIQWGLPLSETSPETIALTPSGPNLDYLVKGDNEPIYFVANGGKYHIPNIGVYLTWGFSDDKIAVVDQPIIDMLSNTGRFFGQVARGSDFRIHLVENRAKRHIETASAAIRLQNQYGSFIGISQVVLNRLSTGSGIR